MASQILITIVRAVLAVVVLLVSGALGEDPKGTREDESASICVERECFPRYAIVGTATLPVLGVTRFRYLFFDVYSIALYAPAQMSSSAELLADVPKRLVIRYHHRFTRDQIIKGGTKMMKKNPEVNFGAISESVARMNQLYIEAVHEQDEYEVSYVPGQGLSLYFNGQLRGAVPGAEFARAYFGIWLSNTPIDRGMRDALLGVR